MKDPTDSLQVAFYGALNGQLAYAWKTYPVYASPQASDDFVVIGDVNVLDDGTDTTFGSQCAVSFDIVTRATSWNPANAVATQLMEIIVGRMPVVDGFTVTVTPYLDSIVHFTESRETKLIYRKLVRIILKLRENG